MDKPAFTVKMEADELHLDVGYRSIDECLQDKVLQSAFENSNRVVCSIWQGDVRLTRDITNYKQFLNQLVANSSTILRASV